ncbi:MAG: hypothetical protein HQK77_19445 [Desulfobacterales bacterium]|nr:hypothetical protein [Desulfobacterales bacterium]
MKTGVIIYVTGITSKNFDEIEAVKHLKIDADKVEFVFSGEEHGFTIWDAWWKMKMTVKGMRRIICMAAEAIGSSQIQLTGRELQLCAY